MVEAMKKRMNNRMWVSILVLLGLMFSAGCQRVQDPWTTNGKAWKEQHFRTDAPIKELRERLMTTQIDR